MSEPHASQRARLRQQRQQLPAAARITSAQGVRRVLADLPGLASARNVAGYWATGGEVPLNLVLVDLERRGCAYWLPRITAPRTMVFARWASGDPVEPNGHGIPEPLADAAVLAPTHLDIVLVPLLGFDAAGNRLGMGGGYYDTGFAFMKRTPRPRQPLLVGVAHAFQQIEQIAVRDWDVPLDFVATEHELIDCNPARNQP